MSVLEDLLTQESIAPPYDSGIKQPRLLERYTPEMVGCKDGHHLHTYYDADGLSTIRLHDLGSTQICELVFTCPICGEQERHTMVNVNRLLDGQYEVMADDWAEDKFGPDPEREERQSDSAKAFREFRYEYQIRDLKERRKEVSQ